jgi:adenylate cyclase
MTVNRRLAAILAADVVGYSRLMQEDEAGTLAALKRRRKEILEPTVARHRGRIVKLMGDGILIEFASAVAAVQCAIELQRGMSAANSSNDANDQDFKTILLRIGMNLGDVIVEGSDLYGDGVNVAARLEAIAEPGTICISAKVRDEVQGKIGVKLDDMGEVALKNMVRPVHAFRLNVGPASDIAKTKITMKLCTLDDCNQALVESMADLIAKRITNREANQRMREIKAVSKELIGKMKVRQEQP